MGTIRKYAFVLALALAVIYVYAPLSLEHVAKLRWLDDINVIVNKSLAPAKPEVHVSQLAPIAAVDELLRIGTRPQNWEADMGEKPGEGHSGGVIISGTLPWGRASPTQPTVLTTVPGD